MSLTENEFQSSFNFKIQLDYSIRQAPTKMEKGIHNPYPKKEAICNFTGAHPNTMTSNFCKIYKSFIAGWLKTFILDKIDSQQIGNIPKSLTSHLVWLLDKILKHQDEPEYWVNFIVIDLKKNI